MRLVVAGRRWRRNRHSAAPTTVTEDLAPIPTNAVLASTLPMPCTGWDGRIWSAIRSREKTLVACRFSQVSFDIFVSSRSVIEICGRSSLPEQQGDTMSRFHFGIVAAIALGFAPFARAQSPVVRGWPVSAAYSRPYYGGFYQGWFPWYRYGYGGALHGQAEVIRAYGAVVNDVESARVRREEANRAKLETQRQRFELENYLRANKPSFAQEQAEIARRRLERIRTSPMPAEIDNGFALNVMLDHVRGSVHRKHEFANGAITSLVLARLNVTSSTVGVGALRHGKIHWPLGLQTLLSPDRRRGLEAQAGALYQGSLGSGIDGNVHRDFTAELKKIQQNVVGTWDKLGGAEYLEAKRFVSALLDAAQALANGEARRQADYEAWVESGSVKTVHEVLD